MPPCKNYYALKILWPQKNLHSHTLQKRNLKRTLSGVWAGAQTEHQVHAIPPPPFISTASLPSSHYSYFPSQMRKLRNRKHYGTCPRAPGNVTSEFELRQSDVESTFPELPLSEDCQDPLSILHHSVYLIGTTKNSVCRSTRSPRPPWRSLFHHLFPSFVPAA